MKISYSLTKRTTKTEKIEKYLKMYIISFEPTASVIIIHSILNYKLMRPISNLLVPNEQKQAKTASSRKKMSEKTVDGIEKQTFDNFFYSQLIFYSKIT